MFFGLLLISFTSFNWSVNLGTLAGSLSGNSMLGYCKLSMHVKLFNFCALKSLKKKHYCGLRGIFQTFRFTA